MNPLQKFILSILMSICLYAIMTLPHFIAFYTMNINKGHYYGIVYPFWLLLVCALIAGPLGVKITHNLSNLSK